MVEGGPYKSGQKFGPYVLESYLGSGAFKSVYKALNGGRLTQDEFVALGFPHQQDEEGQQNRMSIAELHTTQRKLNRACDIPSLIAILDEKGIIEPIRLSQFEDGSIQIEDGHHRCAAIWLSGRRELRKGEYILCQKEFDKNTKSRMGFVTDLVKTLEVEWTPTRSRK